MKEEISAAASFLTRLLNEQLNEETVGVFQSNLGALLAQKFQGHWFPEKPCKGQAYRCIRVNGRERRDPLLEQAARMCGLRYESLKLPVELTLWVDPQEVCCRFGEDEGSYCTVASFKENKENLSDNVKEETQGKCNNQMPADSQKKPKNRRKSTEKMQKKPITSRSISIPPPKMPLIPSKAPQWHPPSFFDWTPPRPFPPRGYFQDVPPFPRRPMKRPSHHFTRK